MARFPIKQVERAARDHIRLAVGHGLTASYHKEKAATLGPKHPDHAAHKEGATNHFRKMGDHLTAGENLMHLAGRTMWERGNSEQVMKGEMDTIAKHPKGIHEGIRARHRLISNRISPGLTLEAGRKKPEHETTAAELSKPFAHEHQVLSHVHHILADHHEALANKAQRKQAPLSPPSHDFLRHSSVAEKHRAAGLHHAAKAGDRPNHEEMRHVIEQHVEHHPIHGMRRPEKAHELLRHFAGKIGGGHSVHAAEVKKVPSLAKQNEAKAKKHYMLAHAHQRLARTETYRGNVKESLNHRDRAQRHIAKGNSFLPEHKREAHFAKALGAVRHAIGRKNFDYAGPVRDFIEKHDK